MTTSPAHTEVQRTRWAPDGPLLRSPLLEAHGLVAGFTTRALGSMGGSLDRREEHEGNRRAVARSLGFGNVVRTRQVHGAEVVHARAPFDPWPNADAIWTDRRGLLLGIAAADCVPVLVADPEPGGVIGVAHGGWAGTSLGVARALVHALSEAGADAARLVAALGPSIGPCCYTIDEQRAATIRARLGSDADGALYDGRFDLWEANARQLAAVGVRTIEVAGICTRCGGEDLWSWRAREEQGQYGVCLGFIGRR